MKFTPTWRTNDVADIPSFKELEDITGMAYDENGVYSGPKEKPDMQLVIDQRTKRQYWAPKEYDEDAIRYGMAKLDKDFNSKEWWGMVQNPDLSFTEKISTAYIEGLKQAGKLVANAPTKIAGAVAGATDAFGIDAGAAVMASLKMNPIFLASNVSRKGLKATAEDYVQLFKDLKTPKGKMGTTASYWRATANNWEETVNKYLPDVDENVKAHSTMVAIGGLAGQIGGSLLIAAATNGVGGLPAVAAVFGGQQFYDIREEYLQKGYDLDAANIFAGFAALSEGGLEAVGFGNLLKYGTLSRSFRNTLIGGLIESVQEMSQTSAEELITNLSGVREETIAQILTQIAISGVAGFIPGMGFSLMVGGENIAQEKAAYELDRAVEQQQQKATPVKEGQTLPGTTPKQELELAKANKGSNPVYETVKNIANAHGVTDEKAIDGFYYFARNQALQGKLGEQLLEGLGKQIVAYKNQLIGMDKAADQDNKKAAEAIKQHLSAESAQEYHDANVKAMEESGIEKNRAEVAAAQLDILMKNLSEKLGLDLQKFKKVVVRAIPRLRTAQAKQEEAPGMQDYSGEIPFQDRQGGSEADNEIKTLQRQINELDKMARSKPRTTLLSTLRKTGVDYSNTRLDPQVLKDLKIKNVPVAKGGLGGESLDYLIQHGFMQDYSQGEQVSYEMARDKEGEAEEMLERAVSGEDVYRMDDMEKIRNAEQAEAYKQKLQAELDEKIDQEGKRGYIKIGDMINEIVLGRNSDVTTLQHEMIHHFRNLINLLAAQGNKNAIALKEQMDSIIEKHKDEVRQKINSEEEVLSEAYEAWLYGGVVAENQAQQKLFDALKQFFQEVYDSVRAITGIRIDPEIDMFFRQLTGQMPIQMREEGQTMFQEGIKYDKNGKADINSPEFKKWFGNSKVVDENGKPLVVYHGTTRGGFAEFEQNEIGSNTGNATSGFFFTDHQMAQTYSNSKREITESDSAENEYGEREDVAGLYPVYLSIKNPEVFDFQGASFDGLAYGRYAINNDENSDLIRQENGQVVLFDSEQEATEYLNAHNIKGTVLADPRIYESTQEVVELAKDLGADGVIIKNVQDEGRYGRGYNVGDVYVAFEPTQIKSVYNKGTFDKNNPNIYYQFGGQKAKTADPLKLNKAEEMEASGADNETIRQETGWFRGADRKWRFEISDQDASISKGIKDIKEVAKSDSKEFSKKLSEFNRKLRRLSKANKKEEYDKVMDEKLAYIDNRTPKKYQYRLDEILEHENLYKAYPELRSLSVKIDPDIKGDTLGSYSRAFKRINLSASFVSSSSEDEIKKTLLHEIAHYIQRQEGFAAGGNPSQFRNKRMNPLMRHIDYERSMDSAILYNKLLKANTKGIKENLSWPSAAYIEKFLPELEKLAAEDEATKRTLERWKDANNKLKDYDNNTAFMKYKRLGGEIEARNVETRANFTELETAMISPESSQDIKNADAIIQFDDGTQLAYNKKEPEVFYQGDKDLIAVHAAKSWHINEVLESGQLVAPSISITKKGQNELNKGNFGDVVLVMNPNRIKYSRDNIYNRDIYSPRLPSPVYKTKTYGYIEQSEYERFQRKWEEDPEGFKKQYGETFDEMIGQNPEKYIFEGFDPRTEKRIYKKYTPANLLSYIKKESLLGGESFNYGLSSFLAKMSVKLNNREELRKESWNLANREEAEEKYEELQKAYSDLLYGDIQKYSKFSEVSSEDFADFLKYNYEGHPEKAAEFLKVDEIPDSLKATLKKFVDEALALPRSYFEAKPMRLVPLSDFVYAITKKGTLTKEQKEKFESYGVEVKEVDSIKDFDFSSLDTGEANDTNAVGVYFQDREQAYRDDRAQRTGAKAADPKPSKERIAKDIEVIRNNGVEKYEPKSRLGASLGNFAKHILLSVRQRAGAIDNKLKAFFDKLDYFQPNLEKKFASKANGFIKKFQGLTEDEKNEFDYYVYNQCFEELQNFLKEKGMVNEYQEVRQLLNFIYAISNQAGIDMGFIEEYFPTSMIDYAGFLDHLKGTDKWSYIAKALREADPEGRWSDKEKAEAVNKLLRGYRLDPVSKPGNTKDRTILYKSPELMKFYEHSDVALIKYLQGMSQALAINKAFGKGKGFNTDETIGAIVLDLINNGTITNKEEAEVKRLLKSRLSYGATPEFISMVKNIGYLQTMNNITSAVTQLGDLYAPFYKYSFGTAIQAIFGKYEITKTDLGLDKIWEEFSDSSKTGIAVDKLFKVIGLEKMDGFGKNVAINASLINLRKQAASGDIALTERLAYTFGKDAGKVLADIKAGNITDDVKILIWSDLADTQPIGRSGVPTGYLDNPHGRLFYQLKTFTLNQISLFYADSLVNIQKGIKYGNKKQFLKGVQNGFKLLLLLTAGNAGADVLKNLIMGRDIDISDTVVSNLLWNLGVSKYTFYKGKREGYANTLFFSYFAIPQLNAIDDLWRERQKIAAGKLKAKDTIAVTYLPYGRSYYWWFGGGSTEGKARTAEMKKKAAAKNRRKKKKK